MLRDFEMKTIAEMTETMAKVLRENGINPMQAMSLVGYSARQLVTDIGRSVNLSADQAVIMSLGAMLPNDYLRDLAGSARPALDGGGCAR